MTEDRYLNSALVIRNLKAARHDEKTYLDKLAKAAVHCSEEGHRLKTLQDKYMLARAIYLTEVFNLVTLTPHEAGLRAAAVRLGRPDPITKPGFKSWCIKHGIDPHNSGKLARVGRSTSPELALNALRKENAADAKRRKESKSTARDLVPRIGRRDSLRCIKIEWHRLSPSDQLAFADWVFETLYPAEKAA